MQVVTSGGKEKNSTLSHLSKNDKRVSSESGAKVDAQIPDEQQHGTATIIQSHSADVNAYKEGNLTKMIDSS